MSFEELQYRLARSCCNNQQQCCCVVSFYFLEALFQVVILVFEIDETILGNKYLALNKSAL